MFYFITTKMTSNFTDTNVTLDDFEIIQTEVKLANELDDDIEIIETAVNPNKNHEESEELHEESEELHEESEEHHEESEELHEESEELHEESEEHHEESEEHHEESEEHAYLDNHEHLKDNYSDDNGHVHGFVNEDGNFIPYDHEDNEHYHNKESYEIFGENFENKVIELISNSLTRGNNTENNSEYSSELENIENFENQEEIPEINSETDECLPFDISSEESISSVWKIIDSYDIKNIYKTDKDGNNLFHYLIENNDIEYIDKLYNHSSELLLFKNNCNETPIDRIKDKTVISNFLVQKLVEENKYMRIDIKYLKDHIDSVKYNFDLYTIIFFGIIVIYFSYKFIKSNSLFIFWK